MKSNPNIVIAGASGYIGQALIPKLLKKFPEAKITALSRSEQASSDPRIQWKACDLFSLKSLEAAIPEKIDLAYYLVHSMGPTAQMDQGSFADYDLILADNFARIMKKVEVGQIVYLGGLIPYAPDQGLSLHLQSRLEVEETFNSAKLPLTVFRAGLIIGDKGSSFQILTKLVSRLPVMICPSWTQTLTTPIDLDSVIDALTASALKSTDIGHVFDLAGCHSLTYVEMMRETARWMGKKRIFVTVPFFTPTLSRLWVSLITGSPKSLVYPLVASLEHPMVARRDHLYLTNPNSLEVIEGQTYFSLLQAVGRTSEVEVTSVPLPRKAYRVKRRTVRSVQRLPLPKGRDAAWIKDEYERWLPRFLAPFVKVKVVGERVRLCVLSQKFVLLELQLNEQRSDRDRQLLYITGGQLASAGTTGRLEFRVVLNRESVLAAIHDFNPTLPWPLYRQTQARLHLWVMRSFAKHLTKKHLARDL